MTWTQTSSSSVYNQWNCIASSSDGTRLAAVDNYNNQGGIWTAQATIQTNAARLTLRHSGTNVTVAWPATGIYTLQQNSNLAARAGWTTSSYTITNSNGTNSITIPAAARTLFFRLIQP